MVDPPVIAALLVADQVYIDQLTGKVVVAGIFDRMRVKEFPVDLPPGFIYARTADARSEYTLDVSILDAATMRELKVFRFKVPAGNGSQDLLMAIPRQVSLSEPCRIRIEAVLNGDQGTMLAIPFDVVQG